MFETYYNILLGTVGLIVLIGFIKFAIKDNNEDFKKLAELKKLKEERDRIIARAELMEKD